MFVTSLIANISQTLEMFFLEVSAVLYLLNIRRKYKQRIAKTNHILLIFPPSFLKESTHSSYGFIFTSSLKKSTMLLGINLSTPYSMLLTGELAYSVITSLAFSKSSESCNDAAIILLTKSVSAISSCNIFVGQTNTFLVSFSDSPLSSTIAGYGGTLPCANILLGTSQMFCL